MGEMVDASINLQERTVYYDEVKGEPSIKLMDDESPTETLAEKGEETKKELSPRELRIMKNNLRKSCSRSVSLIEEVKPVLGKLIKMQDETKALVPVDIEVDLSLITRENAEEYAEMWAYLVLACSKYKNINFVFNTIDYPGKEEQENPVTYEEFSELLANEVKMKASIFCSAEEVEDMINNRIKKTSDETREGLIRIPIWSREYLTWMSTTDVNLLEKNQYPVALDEPIRTRVGTALRNFEAALAIGLCKAALAIAKRRDEDGKKEEELPELRKEILEKLENLYKIFNERIEINEDTLMFMMSSSPRTRIELAIYHALPPIVRMPIDMLQEEIKLANLYLQQA
jgi:hypothetical protein